MAVVGSFDDGDFSISGESDKEDGLQGLKLGTAVEGQVDEEGREREWCQK